MTPQQAEKAATDDRLVLMCCRAECLRQRDQPAPAQGRTSRPAERAPDRRAAAPEEVATGRMTPEQAAKAAETERINVYSAEVARLRQETDNPRTASTEEVEALRERQTELRQLEVAAGRMTPQQAEKAAAEDRVTLLRAEQNVLRRPGQSITRGRPPSAISRSASCSGRSTLPPARSRRSRRASEPRPSGSTC